MSDEGITISMRCLFCNSTQFEIAEGYQPKEGDVITCAGCGRDNPYELMLEAACEEGVGFAKESLQKKIDKLKKQFKGNNFITFK
jgi:hypothetical protein